MKYKRRVNNKLRYFGETDTKKRVITINKKLSKTRTLTGAKKKNNYPGVLDTITHEEMHAKHPKMTEKQVYKKTKKVVRKLTKKQKKRYYNKYNG